VIAVAIVAGLGLLYLLVEGAHANMAATVPRTIATDPTVGSTIAEEGQAGSSVAQAANAIPVAGPIISTAINAILGPLLGASKARAQAATNENAAVAGLIPQFDQQIAAIFAAVNNGTLTPAQASTAMDQVIAAYWVNVTPHIQAGRNGCNSGASMPSFTGSNAGAQQGGACGVNGYYGCTGMSSWGAACCVGSTLMASVANLKWLLAQPAGGSAQVCQIIGNAKYGGASRAGYRVSYEPAGIGTSLESHILSLI
jgi:hypothetical protein